MSGFPEPASLLAARPALLRGVQFACGAALTLTFAPFGLWWLAPLLVAPLLLACAYAAPRQAAWLGFSFGTGLFLGGTYWLYISVHVFGRAPVWLALFIMLALVLIMATWLAACGWLLSRSIAGRPLRLLWCGPAAWVLIEWLRGWVLSGFPWLSLGYAQIDGPLAGYLPLTGVYGVSLLTALAAAALPLLAWRRTRWPALAALCLPALAGPWLGTLPWTSDAGPAQTATIVQGGVSQDRKWLREQFRDTLTIYREALLAHPQSDIVIWPEVAIPALDIYVADYLNLLENDLTDGQTLMLGILEADTSDDAERIYNSVLAFDGERRQAYRKRHLVPFGEYFPVPAIIREWMRLMSLPNSDLTPGSDDNLLLTTATRVPVAVAICYEDAYGAEQLPALRDAQLLINVSNDAWFGDSIAPHQHLQIARVRAAEARRFTVRATNNGISAFIAPDGSLLETAPQFEFATLTADVTPRRGLTPYARFGNWPVIGLVVLLLGAAFVRTQR